MIALNLLLSLALTPGPQHACTPVDATAELTEIAQARIELDETHFSAQSFGETPLFLAVSSEVSGLQFGFWLNAGARYEEDFGRGTLSGLHLEVLSLAEGAPTTTGLFDLEELAPDDHGQLWVLDCGHALTRREEGAALSVATPAGSLLPPELNVPFGVGSLHSEPVFAEPGPTHVPVPTPTDQPKESPPRKRRRQLPPV